MKALSILQPWAWLIVNGYKNVENRCWSTKFRGSFLIHAGKRWGVEQREDLAFVRGRFPEIPLPVRFDLGAIVGVATLVDCVEEMDNPWFFGPHGFVLKDRRAAPSPIPYKGALGFFKVPDAVVGRIEAWRDAP